MKLSQRLLVAPAALGLLSPLAANASDVDFQAISNYSIEEIDVDSNTLNPFNQNDVKLLELVSRAVSKKMKKNKIILYELN